MTTQLLIYKTAVLVSQSRHGDRFVESGTDFSFSKNVNSVPLTAVEFPLATAEYPIVFAGSGDDVSPAVILGVQENQNLYLTAENKWDAKYIPAFIRRYPFVFSQSGDQFMLCIDEEFSGLNANGAGVPLFKADGSPSFYVENVLKFLQDYQLQFNRTKQFCANLVALDLLEPMQADVKLEQGQQFSLRGFMVVNKAKLKALSGEQLAALAATDELELIYLHLQSMRNFNVLKDALVKQSANNAAADAAEALTPNDPALMN